MTARRPCRRARRSPTGRSWTTGRGRRSAPSRGRSRPRSSHYSRPGTDYPDWGLHLWGDAIAPGVETGWGEPRPPDGFDAYGAFFRIPVQDESKPVNFIVHKPLGDSVPTTREPGGDRSLVPAVSREICLRQGDPAIYRSPPAP
ncbi:MAG: hypothetical protein H0X17_19505 [Deltaproteobacteria bacterium]|nr:hypothetical protein [Deltaproteobacteria bacterium]